MIHSIPRPLSEGWILYRLSQPEVLHVRHVTFDMIFLGIGWDVTYELSSRDLVTGMDE